MTNVPKYRKSRRVQTLFHTIVCDTCETRRKTSNGGSEMLTIQGHVLDTPLSQEKWCWTAVPTWTRVASPPVCRLNSMKLFTSWMTATYLWSRRTVIPHSSPNRSEFQRFSAFLKFCVSSSQFYLSYGYLLHHTLEVVSVPLTNRRKDQHYFCRFCIFVHEGWAICQNFPTNNHQSNNRR